MELSFPFTAIVVIIVFIYLLSSIKILAEYERGVIFRLGRLLPDAKGPGLIFVFAPLDRIVRISLRQEALEVPPQDIITRDNVTLKVNAVIFLRVIEPRKAVVEVSNYVYQTSQFAQTTLRSVLGEQELDELLAHRDKINLRLQSILDTHTAPWGVKVANVEVKQVDMPESHAARHGETGRSGAREAIEDHSRGRRIFGRATPGRRGPSAGHGTGQRPASLPADSDGDRRGEEYDRDIPGSGGFLLGNSETHRESWRDRPSNLPAAEVRNLTSRYDMATSQDTEITLGTGKMLVLFFGLVALCAVFFGTGFSLGSSSVKPMTPTWLPQLPAPVPRFGRPP